MTRQEDSRMQPEAAYELEAYHRETGERLGHLGDLTDEGVILVSTRKYDVDDTLPLKLVCSRDSGWNEVVEAEAVVTGTNKSIQTAYYDNELYFVNPDEALREQLRHLRDNAVAPDADLG